jgi:hypothetical protein
VIVLSQLELIGRIDIPRSEYVGITGKSEKWYSCLNEDDDSRCGELLLKIRFKERKVCGFNFTTIIHCEFHIFWCVLSQRIQTKNTKKGFDPLKSIVKVCDELIRSKFRQQLTENSPGA